MAIEPIFESYGNKLIGTSPVGGVSKITIIEDVTIVVSANNNYGTIMYCNSK